MVPAKRATKQITGSRIGVLCFLTYIKLELPKSDRRKRLEEENEYTRKKDRGPNCRRKEVGK